MELDLFLQTFGRYSEENFARWRWFRLPSGRVIVVFMLGMETVNF